MPFTGPVDGARARIFGRRPGPFVHPLERVRAANSAGDADRPHRRHRGIVERGGCSGPRRASAKLHGENDPHSGHQLRVVLIAPALVKPVADA